MQLKVGYFGASAAYNETLKDLVWFLVPDTTKIPRIFF
jgi:hypothetical protein